MPFKTTPPYIPIRDDSCNSLCCTNEYMFVRDCLLWEHGGGMRLDGRSLGQLRPHRLQLTRSAATGTTGCTVQWGRDVTVHAQVQGSIVPPPSPLDRPNEGAVVISVELSPMASTLFKYSAAVTNGSGSGGSGPKGGGGSGAGGGGPVEDVQKLAANRVLRGLENLLGQCLDTEALVVVPGQWAWQLQVSVSVWDCGNHHDSCTLLDASVLATMAALRHYRQLATTTITTTSSSSNRPATTTPTVPQTQSLDLKEGSPLPLHHTPLSITFAWLAKTNASRKSGTFQNPDATMNVDNDDDDNDEEEDDADDSVWILADPSWQEQRVTKGQQVTLQLNVHGELCGLVSSGGAAVGGMTSRLLRTCHRRAQALLRPLVQSLETTLAQAQEQAFQQGLERIQQQQRQEQQLQLQSQPPPTWLDSGMKQGEDEKDKDKDDDAMMMESTTTISTTAATQRAWQAAEEQYRQQALDYNLGHQAVRVREDDDDPNKKGPNQPKPPAPPPSSRLLTSLLQAASHQAQQDLEHDEQQQQRQQQQKAKQRATQQQQQDDTVGGAGAVVSRAEPDATGVTVLPFSSTTSASASSSTSPRDDALWKVPLSAAHPLGQKYETALAQPAPRPIILQDEEEEDGDDSEEEEETTMQLQSEFAVATATAASSQPTNKKDDNKDNDDDDDANDYDAIKKYNKKFQAMEEEKEFWQANRNTNREVGNKDGDDDDDDDCDDDDDNDEDDDDNDGATKVYRGADKARGGRIPKTAPTTATLKQEEPRTKTKDANNKPTKAEARRKARTMAKRRDQQKKAMSKRNG
ncbi:hypothetical protein ACA910_018032 [Epithemia clementina (nom. ined.)]